MDYAIEVQDLTKVFGKLVAVNHISFQIPRGVIFGFLGPNGSGKSTTVRMLCGILMPTSGQGRVLGHDLIKEPEKIKAEIGYMSQKFSLYEDLTVIENILFYARIYGLEDKEALARAQDLLKLADLAGKENSLAGHLSGGLKQRLALISALIHRPKLIFLDEPTAGVDPVSRKIFWEIIRHLAKEGVTVLVTTHYMDEAEKCDVIGFTFKGELIAFDEIARLKEKHGGATIEDIFIYLVEDPTIRNIRQVIAEKEEVGGSVLR